MTFSPDDRLLASASSHETVQLWDPATGVLQQTLSGEVTITYIELPPHVSHLKTDLGLIDIQSNGEKAASEIHPDTRKIVIDQQWIQLKGEKIIRLPPEYRPSCFVAHGSTIYIGHA
jgi:WD40 repeat protein